ncbi:MAG: ABC transporter substrate-binding protein [Lachnospiraceae bacterium]|jgi:branched-chain amino acid transport system substrate-binding protein|nr:ABC transporter substrate-binding protein [Lachnospiraceae bacterium]
MFKKTLKQMLAVAAALTLAGCAGQAGSGAAAPATQAASAAGETAAQGAATQGATTGAPSATTGAPAAEPEVIKIGFLTPLSGGNATYGIQCKEAGQMIADIINEAHPELAMLLAEQAGLPNLNGARIELVVADHKSDPTVATSEAKRLITEENVVAITGQYTSSITKAVAVVTENYEIPLLTAGSSPSLTAPETGLEWYFRFGPNDTYYIRDSFEFIKKLNEEKGAGFKTVAFVSEDTEFGANIALEEVRFAEEYGFEVVANITYSASATNVSAEVMKVKAANPDVIMMSSYAADAILYLKTFKEQNYVPKMLLGQRGGFVQTDFLDTMGLDTEYIFTTGGWSADIDNETSKQMIELYKEYTPDGAELSEGHCKDMINVLLIALAINQAGTTESKALQAALRNLDADTSRMPIPWDAITMDEYGQNTSANAFVLQRKDGVYQTVYPAEYAALESIIPMPAWSER